MKEWGFGMNYAMIVILSPVSMNPNASQSAYGDTFNMLIEKLAERKGVTKQLKAENQMESVGRMNNLRNRANKITNAELQYL